LKKESDVSFDKKTSSRIAAEQMSLAFFHTRKGKNMAGPCCLLGSMRQ
jgi:hypothetical protein